MKFVLAFLVGMTLAQSGEPPEYPMGVFCSPTGDVSDGKIINKDHPCECKNMSDRDHACEVPTTNDPICNQYCHESKCSCPLTCDLDGKAE